MDSHRSKTSITTADNPLTGDDFVESNGACIYDITRTLHPRTTISQRAFLKISIDKSQGLAQRNSGIFQCHTFQYTRHLWRAVFVVHLSCKRLAGQYSGAEDTIFCPSVFSLTPLSCSSMILACFATTRAKAGGQHPPLSRLMQSLSRPK